MAQQVRSTSTPLSVERRVQIDPVLLSDARTLAAYLIFFASYFVFALGKFPWMKIDRPGRRDSTRL